MAAPLERLGAVVAQRKESIQIDDFREYKRVKVRLHQQGVELRDLIVGGDLRTKTQQVCRAGDVIFAEIDAKVGGYGVIPDDLDGAIVSSHYFLFTIDTDRVDRRFLELALKNPGFQDQIVARGSTNYAAIRAEQVLELRVPLPDKTEQRRVVSLLDNILACRTRIRELSTRAASLVAALHRSSINRFAEGLGMPNLVLADVLAEEPRNGWSVRCDNAEDGVSVLGLGAVRGFRFNPRAVKTTSEIVDPDAYYWLRPGDLLISRSNTPLLVGHAAIYDGIPAPCIFPDLLMRTRIDESRADTAFVLLWLQSDVVRSHVVGRAKGTSPTMVKIGKGDVLAIPFPELDVGAQQAAARHLTTIGNSWNRLSASVAGRESRQAALEGSVLHACFSAR